MTISGRAAKEQFPSITSDD